MTANHQTPESSDNLERSLKIMPLGDSITDGYFVPGGYRIELWNSLTKQGYKIEFIGSVSNGPDSLASRNHEGHSGWRIDEICQQVPSWLQKYQPEMILLLIGTNDIAQGYNIETARDRLERLVEEIFKFAPKVQLLVASIPPIGEPTLNLRVMLYNQNIQALVERRQQAGEAIRFVDLYYSLNLHDLPDGVHPNQEGFRKIAIAWEKAIVAAN
jgi:acyl-CoA thioesterase I